MMTAQEIANEIGFFWNGVWVIDEAKFTKAIALARDKDAKPTRKGQGMTRLNDNLDDISSGDEGQPKEEQA